MRIFLARHEGRSQNDEENRHADTRRDGPKVLSRENCQAADADHTNYEQEKVHHPQERFHNFFRVLGIVVGVIVLVRYRYLIAGCVLSLVKPSSVRYEMAAAGRI